ncbi:MAG: Flp pilus assembly protein CpaB [Acidobacteria bacterium]|nr:MAG: Flp pilus assembly protein CpaB [Acidobacteriota bacterium]PYR27461.1 MAG: Flp pilus assembly protein CpaB [Acidobacteriota bacterium]
MARMRVFIVFVFAVTVGGVFALATYNYVQKIPARTVSIPTTPVVVAASDLDIGAELRREDLRIIEWPANALPADAIHDLKDAVGRGLIMPVIQNEPILPMKLASKEAGAGLPPAIPPGLRAVSVRVNEVIGVAGYVLPGTHVDVVATVSPTQNQHDMTSKVILTNVLVLAAGTKIDRMTDKDKPMPVTVVTLLVAPEESERLTLASSEGKIQLALRNPLDRDTPVTRGIKPASLLGAAPIVRVARAQASVQKAEAPRPVADAPTVEIIRGDKRAREVVRQEQ